MSLKANILFPKSSLNLERKHNTPKLFFEFQELKLDFSLCIVSGSNGIDLIFSGSDGIVSGSNGTDDIVHYAIESFLSEI